MHKQTSKFSKNKTPVKSKAGKGASGGSNFSKNLFANELRKKDKEIHKLKELLKKSSLMHKDKIESYTKMSRFEINNFYDGMEDEFNILDQKKNSVFDGLMVENKSLRQVLMTAYGELQSLSNAGGAWNRNQADGPDPMPQNFFNKPFHLVERDVEHNIL